MDSFALAACYKPVSVLNPPMSEFREHVHGHSRTVLFFSSIGAVHTHLNSSVFSSVFMNYYVHLHPASQI